MQQLLSMGALPSTLSSRAKPRDLRLSGPFVEMFFDRADMQFHFRLEQMCRGRIASEIGTSPEACPELVEGGNSTVRPTTWEA